MIHDAAIVDPKAQVADDAEIGPWTYIGPNVVIGAKTKVGPHVVIKGPTTIGEGNQIFQFASIGEDPQDKKYQGEETRLEIGDNNVIRENVTLNRGTGVGGGVTRLGNHNLIMAYVHIAHDCLIGDHTIFANNATLAGHVTVRDHAILSGFTAVNQFAIVGAHSFVAHSTMVVRDVVPYVLVCGDPAEPFGLNVVGLKRRGFTTETITALRRAYKVIFRQGLKVQEAINKLKEMVLETPEVQIMIDSLESSERGIAR